MNRTPRIGWVLCGLLFVATALSFLDRQVLSVLAPVLTAEFGMSNAVYSRVVFAFVLSYTIMFSVGGRLMDRLGVPLGMAFALGVWSAASAAHALAAGALGLGIARFFLGFGEGACFPAATKGATEWFPLEKRALAIGIANGGSAFGAVLAPPLTAWVAGRFGWRGAFLATGALGLTWLAAWVISLRAARGSLSGGYSARGRSVPLRQLLVRRQLWHVLAARFFFDPVFYFYMFWIPQYLARERGFSLDEIGSRFWIPFLALGVSNIGSGRLSDILVRRGWAPRRARSTLLGIAAFLTPVSWLAVLAPTPGWAIGLMSGLMLAHGLWISNFLAFLSDEFPSQAIATVTGLSGTAGGIAGMLSSLAVGAVVDRYSFVPVFAVSGVLYPLALIILLSGGGSRSPWPAVSESNP
ncbi:MAG: MFS transporter [Acidobacteria bacterium]|nr:MFS transporter [Acidobacteriota bacterium]